MVSMIAGARLNPSTLPMLNPLNTNATARELGPSRSCSPRHGMLVKGTGLCNSMNEGSNALDDVAGNVLLVMSWDLI